MGLPCAHILLDCQQQKDGIHLNDIHAHWHFIRPDPTAAQFQLGQLLVREPIVAKPKGRPTGSKNKSQPLSSTRRDPSSFELSTRHRQGSRTWTQTREVVDAADEMEN
jgi:hypothetical protein